MLPAQNHRGASRPSRAGRGLLAVATVVLAAWTGRVASADAVFRVTPLGGLGSGAGYGMSVNASGQVAGYTDPASGPAHAALTGAGGQGLTDLGTLGGSGPSAGQAVNASGQVAGFSDTSGGFIHAFVTAPGGGGMTDLGTLGGTTSLGFAVNDAGQVAGYSTLTVGGQVQTHAFATGPGGGGMTDLGALGTGTLSAGYAINASGQVAGYSYLAGATGYYHAFLTMNGTMKDLGTLDGGTSSVGQSVNASGQVAGTSFTPGWMYRAFLSDASGGALHDLGALTPGGSSYAYGVNDAGQVVGYASTSGGRTDAFLYANGQMFDLNALVPAIPGVRLTQAIAITDNDLIVALGLDALGQTGAYLLTMTGTLPDGSTAVPEPSSLASLALGLAWLARHLARRSRTEALP